MLQFSEYITENMSKTKTYAVDLDGTLAKFNKYVEGEIGNPVKPMLNRIKTWLRYGHKVVIFTARAGNPTDVSAIKRWLKKNNLPNLKITNVKTPDITEIWDDRAVSVYKNQGLVK